MTCRKRSDGIETEESRYLGKQPGSDLLIAQAVPGMEAARAWLRLWHETWEPVASNVMVGLASTRPTVREVLQLNCEGQSTDAARDGLPVVATRLVMRVELGGGLGRLAANHRVGGADE